MILEVDINDNKIIHLMSPNKRDVCHHCIELNYVCAVGSVIDYGIILVM